MADPVDGQDLREQVTLRELLLDPVYKQWFRRRPQKIKGRWRVYAQLEPDAKWMKRDFDTWTEGYNYVAKNIRKFHDAALSNRVHRSRPPVVRDPVRPNRRRYYRPVHNIIDHRWCEYCRRPTVMRVFARHHNVGKCTPRPRCTICGQSEQYLTKYP